jgi:hypothetical protein
MVPEIKTFIYFIFLTVCDSSVMTYAEKFRFSNFEKF